MVDNLVIRAELLESCKEPFRRLCVPRNLQHGVVVMRIDSMNGATVGCGQEDRGVADEGSDLHNHTFPRPSPGDLEEPSRCRPVIPLEHRPDLSEETSEGQLVSNPQQTVNLVGQELSIAGPYSSNERLS